MQRADVRSAHTTGTDTPTHKRTHCFGSCSNSLAPNISKYWRMPLVKVQSGRVFFSPLEQEGGRLEFMVRINPMI